MDWRGMENLAGGEEETVTMKDKAEVKLGRWLGCLQMCAPWMDWEDGFAAIPMTYQISPPTSPLLLLPLVTLSPSNATFSLPSPPILLHPPP